MLVDDRLVLELPLRVETYAPTSIEVLEIEVESETETVDIEKINNFTGDLPAETSWVRIGTLKIYSSKNPSSLSTVTLKVKYLLEGATLNAYQELHYAEIRNGISAGIKRFIDVNKDAASTR